MTNNDVLRRVRYIFDYNDAKMISLFELGGQQVSRPTISDWLKKDEDVAWNNCSNMMLASFLNGLIVDKRGKKDGAPLEAETTLNNNLVLLKLRIALNLKAEDVLEVLALAGFKFSKHELSALFRKPGHKHYRECQDQVLRNFLHGLQIRFRPSDRPSGQPSD